MGGNMRDRLRAGGHEVVGYDPRPEISDAESLEAMVAALEAPRTVWVMVPSGEPTRQTVAKAEGACSRPATPSSTAATRAGPTTR
ncbi:hypothetical protein GCM10025868_23060 [Angustibacter aerolatus]|uniref:6-phosphogluconate dehydrogenase NADP-binding domain-containing protein n=1 Tax=Angustibacter aerolatus TaxID=1162965 RepID=A0ABQ6JFT3_9ACTN|nr:hypothetical protein GCM10025868_23060 [Angustibacter aerolatus]